MSIYDIRYELEETRDGVSEYTDAPKYGIGAVYGEKLELLIADLHEAESLQVSTDKKLVEVTKERDKIQKELDQIKEELTKAFVGGIDIQTTQGKRLAYPGLIVMFRPSGGNDIPAIVLEVCGFPQGKLGLRTFTRNNMDRFVYATYHDQLEGRIYADTWRFID